MTSTAAAPSSSSIPLARFGGILLVALSGTLFLLLTRLGIGIMPDSVRYMGLSDIPYDAPLYPWLLMSVHVLGLKLDSAAELVGLALVCANTWLIWHLLERLTQRPWHALIGTALIVFSPQFVAWHAVAMSEPVFICLALVCLLTLAEFWDTRRRAWLIFSATMLGLASLARFVAPPLGAAIVVVLLLDGRVRIGRRVMDCALFTGISAAIFLTWLVLSEALVGHSIGRTLHFYGGIDRAGWIVSLKTLLAFLLPEQIPPSLRIAAFAICLIGCAALAVWWAREGRSQTPRDTAREQIPIVLGLFVVFYLMFLLVAFYLEANQVLTGRYALPAYIATVMMLTIIASASGEALGFVRRARQLLVGIAIVVLAGHLVRTIERTGHDYLNGIGYASLSWQQSPIMFAIARLPARATLYSNGPDAIEAVVKRPAHYVPMRVLERTNKEDPDHPLQSQIAALNAHLQAGNTYVVFLSQITWRSDYLISEAALCQQLGLELIDNEKDGRIYTLPKAPLEKPVLPRGAPGAT